MKNDEKGSLVVEASLSFVIFVLVLTTFISLINVMWLYMRVQSAMTGVVSELSSYSYVYSAVGLKGKSDEFKGKSANVDELFSALEGLGSGLDGLYEGNIGEFTDIVWNADNIMDIAGAMANDPKATLQGFLALRLDGLAEEGKTRLMRTLATEMMGKYIEVDAGNIGGSVLSADEFLQSFGVKGGMEGLNFDKSKIFADANYDVIDLVITYEIQIPMSPIPLKAKMLQRATTYGWMDGDGTQYGTQYEDD